MHALTDPLVTDSDGNKFGKSTGGGSLWLDPEMTSPYAWYQYFVNTADADVIRYLRWFTFLSADELAELETGHGRTSARARGAASARAASSPRWCTARRSARPSNTPARRCSGGASWPTRRGDAGRGVARGPSVAELKPGGPDGITDLLVASGLSASKGAARRTIGEGGVYVNNVRVESDDWVPQPSDFLHGRWLVLRRGKRNIAGVERVGLTSEPTQACARGATRTCARLTGTRDAPPISPFDSQFSLT